MEGLAYYLLGVVSGIVLVFAWFWLISKNIKSPEHERDDKADWWKRGDEPPWEDR